MPEPVPRFPWKFGPFDLLDAPERYRTLYAFAAATLNLSTSLWTLAAFLSDPNPVTQACALETLRERAALGDVRPPVRDGVTALRHAMTGARELFLLCQEADATARPHLKRWKRFPRFFLTTKEGNALSQFELKHFIVDETGQAAVTLLAGALQLQDHAGLTPPGTAGAAPARGPFMAALRSQVAEGVRPDRTAMIEHLAGHTTSYRVRYNLACYHSREILAPGAAPEDRAAAVQAGLGQLTAAIDGCPLREREDMRRQAARDPTLVGLRREAPGAFSNLMGLPAAAPGTDAPTAATGHAAGPGAARVVEHAALAVLVADAAQERRLGTYLRHMRLAGERMPRRELCAPQNAFAQQVEELMASAPEAHDAQDRVMLARVLFLPEWTGVPPEIPAAPVVLDVVPPDGDPGPPTGPA